MNSSIRNPKSQKQFRKEKTETFDDVESITFSREPFKER